jgi:hypothetical protein
MHPLNEDKINIFQINYLFFLSKEITIQKESKLVGQWAEYHPTNDPKYKPKVYKIARLSV